jgi:hypothetical protein
MLCSSASPGMLSAWDTAVATLAPALCTVDEALFLCNTRVTANPARVISPRMCASLKRRITFHGISCTSGTTPGKETCMVRQHEMRSLFVHEDFLQQLRTFTSWPEERPLDGLPPAPSTVAT